MQSARKLCIGFMGAFIVYIASGFLLQAVAQEAKTGHPTDRACLSCHKIDKEKMLGAHATNISPNSHETVSCRNCHGNNSRNHRDGADDVMKFQADYFAAKFPYRPDEQNGVCMSCHEPDKLRESLWAHDVHITKSPCATCHQLHPKEDPMKGIAPKERIQLCVTCHKKQHELNSAQKEQ